MENCARTLSAAAPRRESAAAGWWMRWPPLWICTCSTLPDGCGRPTAASSLASEVWLTQSDIRELQLAKGAMAAGLELLDGASARDLHLAGAFGNCIRAESARRIGLLPESAHSIHAAGNTALRGARMLLLAPSRRSAALARLQAMVSHVELHAEPLFQDRFVDCMAFPARDQRPDGN